MPTAMMVPAIRNNTDLKNGVNALSLIA